MDQAVLILENEPSCYNLNIYEYTYEAEPSAFQFNCTTGVFTMLDGEMACVLNDNVEEFTVYKCPDTVTIPDNNGNDVIYDNIEYIAGTFRSCATPQEGQTDAINNQEASPGTCGFISEENGLLPVNGWFTFPRCSVKLPLTHLYCPLTGEYIFTGDYEGGGYNGTNDDPYVQ